MIETFLFLLVYTGIVGATGFLMGRVFYLNEKQLANNEINNEVKTNGPETT